MKRYGLLLVVLGAAFLASDRFGLIDRIIDRSDAGDEVFAAAYREHTSNLQVSGSGVVSRLLADDVVGRRHQRFILRLSSGQTLLMAHNIDLAPRVPSLSVGDSISFRGEYEWNAEGGVVHWTHRDPDGRHEAGWLKHNGQIYQ